MDIIITKIKIKKLKRIKKMIKSKIFMNSNFRDLLFKREKQNKNFRLMEELTWILIKLNIFKISKLILIKKLKSFSRSSNKNFRVL